jgi:hypothetical protein
MNPEQFEQLNKSIQNSIATSIESNVNGKIRKLDAKIDEYIKSDDQWKADVKPYIESMRQFNGFTTIGATILKGVLLIGGAVGVMYGLFLWIANLN